MGKGNFLIFYLAKIRLKSGYKTAELNKNKQICKPNKTVQKFNDKTPDSFRDQCSKTRLKMSSVEEPGHTNKVVLEKYLSLPQGARVCATYVWIDGSGESMRSKVKCLDSKPSKVEDLPVWNYDGSSCYQVRV